MIRPRQRDDQEPWPRHWPPLPDLPHVPITWPHGWAFLEGSVVLTACTGVDR